MSEENNNEKEKTQLELAREAGNTWTFEGREMPMFVAEGKAWVAVDVLNRQTRQPDGKTLVHAFEWERKDDFVKREQSLVTKLKSVGRNTKQAIDTANMVEPNAKLYEAIITGGEIIFPSENGETKTEEVSREKMLLLAKNYPEFASEAIESWLEGWHFEVIDENSGSLDWIFQNGAVVKVLGWIGLRSVPDAACILTFNAPPSEKRRVYDDERQIIDSDRIGELKVVDVKESFVKKLQYGATFLQSVEGIAVGAPGIVYKPELKEDFITLFNPLSFAEAVEKMHESFDFTKGKAASS